jgi:hypothetical protein
MQKENTMQAALKLKTRVLPGKRIEVTSPELTENSEVELIVMFPEQRPDQWFWALRAITGANPIKPEQQGRIQEMAAAWIEWGRERGVIA